MTDQRADKKSAFFTRSLGRKLDTGTKPVRVWNSRLSWRIALSVFLTILTVQMAILLIGLKDFEREKLNELQEVGRAALAPVIDGQGRDMFTAPLSSEQARRLLMITPIRGFTVYNSGFNLLGAYGEPPSVILRNLSSLSQSHLSPGGQYYEMIYHPTDLGQSYYVVAKLDASYLGEAVFYHVRQALFVMLLLSAFVTSVLMITLGKWLLEPILFMRDSLRRAAENPEDPKIETSPFNPQDEIGSTIALTQRLIEQNATNIKQIKSAAEDKIHRLAYYDSLTGLPNRTLFLQKLVEQGRLMHDTSQESPTRFAVITMDLDHFKDINDSMGHNVGDAILRGVGKRLKSALPESAFIARAGEDEYAIMMPLSGGMPGRDVAEKIVKVIRGEPFKVFNENFQVRASVGVSTFPDDGMDPDQILKNADIALNRAKEEGRDIVKEYSEDFDRAVQARFQMLRDLRDAMDNQDLTLYFQPQFDLGSGRMIGAEALIRWFKKDNSKNGGSFVSPAEFIPIAESSGLIVPIGEWVMRHACERAVEMHKAGHPIRIAVNVSGAQFYQSDLVAYTEKVLQETGIDPALLELEVTESVFMQDISHTVDILQKLHALGLELAIDDFGTGYSSLSYLRQFPIDRLKIDQSFIRNALNNADDAAIAKTIIGLGHSLNLKVIAEGVETKEHETFLINQGCDEVQGFRYSKPVPYDQLVAFAAQYDGKLSSFDRPDATQVKTG